MPRLISLSEHNGLIQNSVADPFLDIPQKNGIACPVCKSELMDTHPNRILTAMPPKKDVHCVKCHWSGTRLC